MSGPPRFNTPVLHPGSLLEIPSLTQDHEKHAVQDTTAARPSSGKMRVKTAVRARRKPNPNARTKARITRIDERLEKVEQDVIIRKQLLEFSSGKGHHCVTCSPLGEPGTCGATCPLLAPRSRRGKWQIKNFEEFKKEALALYKLYTNVVNEMNERGERVYSATVSRWERDVEKLHHAGLNFSEIMELRDWCDRRKFKWGDRPGSRVDWIMAQNWRERQESSDVAPDEQLSQADQL